MARNEYYSHSKVRTWRRCHKMYDYKYEQGLIRRTAEAPLLRGITYHAMLDAQVLGQDPLLALDEYKKVYAGLWEEEKGKYPDPDELELLYYRYQDKYQNDGLDYGGRSEIEVRAEYKGIQFMGIIDKIPTDKAGRSWICDHKCLDSNHWVETNRGKIRMGDLTTEHQVVSSNGKFISILEICHQVLPGYRIDLVGGKSFNATAEHRWPVLVGSRSERTNPQIINTQSLMDYPKTYLIPSPSIGSLPENLSLAIDPYVMGAMLGDGSLTQGVRFCCPDNGILREFMSRLPSNCKTTLVSSPGRANSYYISGLRGEFRNYGLTGKRSYEKHIPEAYFKSSTVQRLDLLRGLMDTDGTVYKSSTYLYVTTSHQLMLDMQRLVISLGGIPLVRSPKSNKYQGGKLGRISYQVKFTLPPEVEAPFYSDRKLSSIRGGTKKRFGSNLRVKSVTPIGDIQVTDITVDSGDHLFSVEGVLTHNTHKVIPDENHRFADLQTVLYYWAESENGRNHSGILWDYIRTKPPTVPRLLVKGGLSKAKNIDTDYETFMAAIEEHKLDPADYTEILETVKDNVFFKRVYLPHPAKELVTNVVEDFFNTAAEIENSTSKARNMNRDCTNCSYFQLCQAEVRGIDGEFLKKQMFKVREKKD